jgi:hypothetical protein
VPHTDNEWQDVWHDFFGSMEGVVNARRTAGPATPARNFAGATASPLLGDIEGGAAYVYAAIRLFQVPNHPYLEDALFDEPVGVRSSDCRAAGGVQMSELQH